MIISYFVTRPCRTGRVAPRAIARGYFRRRKDSSAAAAAIIEAAARGERAVAAAAAEVRADGDGAGPDE